MAATTRINIRRHLPALTSPLKVNLNTVANSFEPKKKKKTNNKQTGTKTKQHKSKSISSVSNKVKYVFSTLLRPTSIISIQKKKTNKQKNKKTKHQLLSLWSIYIPNLPTYFYVLCAFLIESTHATTSVGLRGWCVWEVDQKLRMLERILWYSRGYLKNETKLGKNNRVAIVSRLHHRGMYRVSVILLPPGLKVDHLYYTFGN